jgi:hypothetical protein
MMKQALTRSGWSRRAGAALVAAALVVSLTGCFAGGSVGGGQTAAAAALEIRSLSGILSSTDVSTDGSYSGFTQLNDTAVVVGIKPDHHIQDPDALVDFLIRVAWSVNDAKPNGDLSVTIDSAVAVDATAAAKAAGWTTAHSLSNDPTSVFVKLSEAKKRLGEWPGKVPKLPNGLIATSTASPTP